MEQQKKALTYAAVAIGILALAMVIFYYVQERVAPTESNIEGDGSQQEEKVNSEQFVQSEFAGLYAPAEGSLEAEGKRVGFFTVSQIEDGSLSGSAKVDTIGKNEVFYFRCNSVRIEEQDFFLNCIHEKEGSISLNGKWQKGPDGTLLVSGKVMWSKAGQLILDTYSNFNFTPGE